MSSQSKKNIANHAVQGSVVLLMVACGGIIDALLDATPPDLQSLDLCNSKHQIPYVPLPRGLDETAKTLSTLVPLLPIALNSVSSWNSAKTYALTSHALGQSTSFGMTELLRYLVVSPSPFLLDRCNLTADTLCSSRVKRDHYKDADLYETVCKWFQKNSTVTGKVIHYEGCSTRLKARHTRDDDSSSTTTTSTTTPTTTTTTTPNTTTVQPPAPSLSPPTCNSTAATSSLLHNEPSLTLAMLGSALVSLGFSIVFWPSMNKSGKKAGESGLGVGIYHILGATALAFVTLVYCIIVPDHPYVYLLLSFLWGALVQFFINLFAYMKQKRQLVDDSDDDYDVEMQFVRQHSPQPTPPPPPPNSPK
jgi:hypothetical protein